MKRMWFGIVLLAVLLMGGIGMTLAMHRIHDPISARLAQAAEASQSGQWDKGKALAQGAGADWKQYWRFTAACADHEPMDEIDGLFAELEVYARQGDVSEFAATCAHLAELTRAMGGAHGASWWNLL